MNFKNPFNRFIKKHNSAPEESNQTESDSELTGWESVAALNPDNQTGITFDELSQEPFAGDPSVTDNSVTLVTPALLTIQ